MSVIPALRVLSSRQAWVIQQDIVSNIDIQKSNWRTGLGEEISDGYDSENDDAIKKQQGMVTDNGEIRMMTIGFKCLRSNSPSSPLQANPAPAFKRAFFDFADCPFPQAP